MVGLWRRVQQTADLHDCSRLMVALELKAAGLPAATILSLVDPLTQAGQEFVAALVPHDLALRQRREPQVPVTVIRCRSCQRSDCLALWRR